MRPQIDDRWVTYFKEHGYPEAKGLAVGMEGAVYSLIPDELVAKVWTRRGVSEVQRLQRFYAELAAFGGPIRTPELVEVELIDGTLVSKERFLVGAPLETMLSEDAGRADPGGTSATIAILDFLRRLGGSDPLRSLAVLDEAEPVWSGFECWSDALSALMARRLDRFGDQLRRDVDNLEAIQTACREFLRGRDGSAMSLIHGDLCGANILVDERLRPLAVVDFGFLSTIGDPAFDASIASGIFNMYGPHVRDIDDEVTAACSAALGYPLDVLLAYRAVYGVLTSNAYAEDGSDGHYRWCVDTLRRRDVQAALGL